MEATGLTDILMEAGLVGSGTIDRIMSGKTEKLQHTVFLTSRL